jgi:hypothetical protein
VKIGLHADESPGAEAETPSSTPLDRKERT